MTIRSAPRQVNTPPTVGELLGIADAEDLHARLVAEDRGRKGDRGEQRLQMARRQIDGEAPDDARNCRAYSLGGNRLMRMRVSSTTTVAPACSASAASAIAVRSRPR